MAEKEKSSPVMVVFDRIVDFFAFIAGALLMFQALSVTLDVVLRFFFNSPILGIESLNEWSLLYIAFLGAAWLQRRGGHVKMDVLSSRLSPKGQMRVNLFGCILGIGICFILIWYGTIVTLHQWRNNIYDYFKLRDVPIAVVTASIPIGSFLFLIQVARDISNLIKSRPEKGLNPEENIP